MATAVASTVLAWSGGAPASAASFAAENVGAAHSWVDGSDRLHSVWLANRPGDAFVRDLHVARHEAGGHVLDPTYGSGGVRTVALAPPWPWDAASGLSAHALNAAFTADGTIVVAWMGSGIVGGRADHVNDRLVIDRYDLSGTRLSRTAPQLLPRNSWCDSFWPYDFDDDDVNEPTRDYCGEDNLRVYPTADILANGVVAIPTNAYWEFPTFGGDAVGTSSVVFFRATDGAVVHTLALPRTRHHDGTQIQALGPSGAVVNTDDLVAETWVTGPSYVIGSWGSASSRTVGATCNLHAGHAGGTVRACVVTGGLEVTSLGTDGAQRWQRVVGSTGRPMQVAATGDDRVAVVGIGCGSGTGPTCASDNRLKVRLVGAVGDPVVMDVSPFYDAVLRSTFLPLTDPVWLGGDRVGLSLTRQGTSVADRSIESRVVQPEAVAPPTCTTGPPIITVTTRGETIITFPPCSSAAGTRSVGGAPTGYEVQAYDGAGAVAATVSVPAAERAARFTGLEVGERYRFRVRATNEGGTGPVSAPSPWMTPGFPSLGALVDRQYADLVGRAPTSAERSDAVTRLGAGTTTVPGFVDGLVEAPWTAGKVGPATRLYRAYFLRDPDSGGLAYWVGRLRAGMRLDHVSSSFAASSEFTRRYGSLSNRQFVELVYLNVLGRTGEPTGVAFWTAQLDQRRRTRGGVMTGFSESSEYRRKSGPRTAVVAAYFGLLGRAPRAAEMEAWEPVIAGGSSRAGLILELLGSDEYDLG